MFTAALLTTAKMRKNLKVHQQRDGWRCGACMQWALLSHEKTGIMPSAATRTGLAIAMPLSLSGKWRQRRRSVVRLPFKCGSEKKCYKWTLQNRNTCMAESLHAHLRLAHHCLLTDISQYKVKVKKEKKTRRQCINRGRKDASHSKWACTWILKPQGI